MECKFVTAVVLRLEGNQTNFLRCKGHQLYQATSQVEANGSPRLDGCRRGSNRTIHRSSMFLGRGIKGWRCSLWLVTTGSVCRIKGLRRGSGFPNPERVFLGESTWQDIWPWMKDTDCLWWSTSEKVWRVMPTGPPPTLQIGSLWTWEPLMSAPRGTAHTASVESWLKGQMGSKCAHPHFCRPIPICPCQVKLVCLRLACFCSVISLWTQWVCSLLWGEGLQNHLSRSYSKDTALQMIDRTKRPMEFLWQIQIQEKKTRFLGLIIYFFFISTLQYTLFAEKGINNI